MNQHVLAAALASVLCSSLALADTPAPVYQQQGTAAGHQLGRAVARVGDCDLDGVDDFAVAATGAGFGGTQGLVRIHSGKTGGTLFVLAGAQSGERFGFALAPAGDFDADGRADLLIGAPNWNQSRGRVVCVSGLNGSQLGEWSSNEVGAMFGYALAQLGDVNGDGRDDFAVSSPFENSGGIVNRGAVRIYSGFNGSLLRTHTPSWGGADASFGLALGGNCDWNGDGRGDLLVGCPAADLGGMLNSGRVDVYNGLTGGLLTHFLGSEDGEYFGASLTGLGSFFGDARSEIAIGAPFSNAGGTDSGRIEIWTPTQFVPMRTHAGGVGDRFGSAVAAIERADGDGFPDYLAGSLYDSYFNQTVGSVRLFSGVDGSTVRTIHGPADSEMGFALASLGDLNGDGLDDVLAGGPMHDQNGVDSGIARVYLPGAAEPTVYGSGKQNSAGCVPYVSWSGTPSRTLANDFRVRAHDVLNQRVGLFFWGANPANLPFGGGTLLVATPIVRTPGQISGGSSSGIDCTGSYTFYFSHAAMQQAGLLPGATVCGQFYHRDPGFPAPGNLGLSNAISFTILN